MSESERTNGLKRGEELPAGYRVEEFEFPAPWGKVAGRWWGPRDMQPIITIHGWQENSGAWDRLIPLLPVNKSFLCIDLPGHGFSAPYPPGMNYYIFWDGISLIRRIVKYYKWERVTLMGHSLGSGLCFMYAACFPDEVDRIIGIDLVSPAVRKPQDGVDKTGPSIDKCLQYEEFMKKMPPCHTYEEVIDIVYDAYSGSISRDDCEILMKRGCSPSPTESDKYYFNRDPRLKVAGLAMMSIDKALEYAKLVRCKVLNIRAIPGQKWERLDYYMDVIKQLRLNTDVVYHEVEGTHHVHLNKPENICELVEEFLQ